MDDLFSRSFAGRTMDRGVNALVSFIGKHCTHRTGAEGVLLPSGWFMGGGLAVMLCIPHGWWNNLFGIAFALVSLLWYLRDCAVFEKKPAPPSRLGLGVWVFLLMCFLSCLWAEYPISGLRVAVFFLCGFLLSYTAIGVFSRRDARERLFMLLYASLLVTSVYGLIDYANGAAYYGAVVGDQIVRRLCSTLEHAINYSEYIAMVLPEALVWCLRRKHTRQKVVLTALLALPMAALLLTYSRTGYLALGLAVAVLLANTRPKWLIPAGIAGIAGIFLLPDTMQSRILSVFQFNNTSASGRFVLWRECLGYLREHWLTGIGLGPENFYSAYLTVSTGTLDFTPPHTNMGYMEMLSSLGIVGFAAFVLFFFGILRRLGKTVRHTEKGEERTASAALLAALAGAAVGNIPEYIWFYPRVLWLWCVIFGLALAAAETKKKP